MDRFPKVAIVYLSYHSAPYLHRALSAVEALDYPREQLGFFIVDNPHPEHGSAARSIAASLALHSNMPTHVVLAQSENRGFAGGNNVGIQAALAAGYEYVFLHNQDGYMAPQCLVALVRALEADPLLGSAQSLIMLHPETDRINSAGNALHFLGFGYCSRFRERYAENALLALSPQTHIGYASGAGLMLRREVLEKHGILDEDLFAYHEDLEYSLRLKSRGYQVALVTGSVFYHEYAFGRNSNKFYLMERNRWAVVLMYYQVKTMLLLLPLAIVVQIGLLLIAARGGWLSQELKVYWYWLNVANWRHWLKKRGTIQAARIVEDKVLLSEASPVIVFENSLTTTRFITQVANPLMACYWRIVRKIL